MCTICNSIGSAKEICNLYEEKNKILICTGILSVDELVAGLARGLRVVFATFAEDVGADVQGGALLFFLVG
jgi:hypothetical protein